jgi:superfamily I DNA/RNA helicase/RecB family exonuclease
MGRDDAGLTHGRNSSYRRACIDTMSTSGVTYRLVRPTVEAVAAPTLDPSQHAVVAHSSGPLLVLAGPGTGKTTTLVEAVVERVRAGAGPDQVLVLTFSRKAADELRERIATRLGRTVAEPAAATFHSFCYSLLRTYGVPAGGRLPRLLSGAEREVRVRELLRGNARGEGKTRWPSELTSALALRGFAREVADLLDRARERGLDGLAVRRLGEQHDRPAWVAAGDFMDEYFEVLEAREEVDYADLIARAGALLDGPAREVRDRYTAVYVDEYQDTDPSQEQLLQRLAGNGRLLVAVGDPDQSIYGFRGADVTGIIDFPERFRRADGRPAEILTLDVCRRSGPELVALSRKVAERIPLGALTSRRDQHRTLVAAGEDAASPPEIRLYSSGAAEVMGIADLLRRAHLLDGVPWSQMAVLVRSGVRSIPTVRRALVAAGVPVSVAADELPLSRDPAVAPLLRGLEYVADQLRPTRPGDPREALSADAAHSLLASPLGGASPGQLRALGRRLRQLDRAASDDGLARPSAELIRQIVEEPRDLDSVEDWVAAPVRRLTGLLAAATQTARDGGTPAEVLWALWNGSDWPRRLAAAAASPDIAGRAADRDLDAVLALFTAASRLEDYQPRATVGALLEEIEAQEIPAAPYEEKAAAKDAVRLLTAHRSKGLEWDLVVVAGVQEGVWPDLRHRGSILAADALDPSGIRPPVSTGALLTEERRLFYVATTRARSRLVMTATSANEDLSERPSRFLEETGLGLPERLAPTTDVLSTASLVARLRRALGDDTTPSAMHTAAAHGLAALAAAVDDDGQPLVPAARPETWWGLADPTPGAAPVRPAEDPVRLSGSAVTDFHRCPRAWFLDREAKARESTSTSQGFGSIVHALAEAVVVGDLEPDLDTLVARLDDVWHLLPYDARWQAERDRAEACKALQRFLDWHRANPRQCAGAEEKFSVSVGDEIVVTGRADRIEVDDEGRVVIVDLKTSKHAPSKDDVRTDPQLGVYQVAVREGAFPEHGTTPGGAELLQLRDALKAGARVQPQPPLADDDPWVDDMLTGIASDIRVERFPARPNDLCDRCRFRTSCPARDEGGQVVT